MDPSTMIHPSTGPLLVSTFVTFSILRYALIFISITKSLSNPCLLYFFHYNKNNNNNHRYYSYIYTSKNRIMNYWYSVGKIRQQLVDRKASERRHRCRIYSLAGQIRIPEGPSQRCKGYQGPLLDARRLLE